MNDTERLAAFLRSNRNEEHAAPMAAYMKQQFPFLGLKAPVRAALTRRYWQEHGLPAPETFREVVLELWALEEREFAYTAMEILERRRKALVPDDLGLVEELIVSKPWWDTVDLLAAHTAGDLLAQDPERIPIVAERWINADNKWLRRSALLFQLRYKKKTDTRLLFHLIDQCKDEKEFFIRKAIGWALREYSKTDGEAVLNYVQTAGLSPFSRQEALKHLERLKARAEAEEGDGGHG